MNNYGEQPDSTRRTLRYRKDMDAGGCQAAAASTRNGFQQSRKTERKRKGHQMKYWTHLNGKQLTLSLACSGLAMVAGCCTRSSGQARYWSRPGPAYASTGSTTSQQYEQPAQTEQYQQTQTGNNVVIPLYEETVNVGKREIEAGAVRLRKVVRTETVNQPVQLRHEEVVIDREPGNGAASGQEQLNQQFQEGETVIRLQREVPVIEKQVQPAGKIVVQTRMAGDQTNVVSEIRREDIKVVKIGNPQNVIIGQNVTTSSETSATGAGSEVGGQNTGAATNSQDQQQQQPNQPNDQQ
jgi:uncharacterized protein (TIGR02271 family)